MKFDCEHLPMKKEYIWYSIQMSMQIRWQGINGLGIANVIHWKKVLSILSILFIYK